MSKSLFVKPGEGVILPNPDRMFVPLAAEGEIVPESPFWLRRIEAGDVTREAMPDDEADGPSAE